MDLQNFYTGQMFDAYKYLGAHITDKGVLFRTYAPHASRVCLIASHNNRRPLEMKRVWDNFWEVLCPKAKAGTVYKYRIYDQDGNPVEHCDPYGFGMELRPKFGSIVRDLSTYRFDDENWMRRRSDCRNRPLNIYEVHIGSFRKKGGLVEDWYDYEEFIDILIPYVKEHGYNYIELMPLNEHPSDISWGYQSTGFFSPTARHGSAEQLKKFVDACHKENIGVIMDFVPVHFALDAYGLAKYDGTPIYEYDDPKLAISEWGTCNFVHGKGEVRSFLQSAANFWLEEFHFDGLRMDAISRAVYWEGDPDKGINQGAVDFLKCMNDGLKRRHPTAILAAEDSSAFPGVTKPVFEGGLGFDYKWDMGWMYDTLAYMKADPDKRSDIYYSLTFSMMYFYNDRFLMPLSHDEVVHGKGSILNRMNGDYHRQLRQARALYMYMFAHTGKMLNFMGNEFAQIKEWDVQEQQQWELLDQPEHQKFHRFTRDLNKLYLYHPALWERDFDREGFRWIDCDQINRCIYAFERLCGSERIIVVMNLSQYDQQYWLQVRDSDKIQPLMFSSWDIYGGTEPVNQYDWNCGYGGINLTLKPESVMYFQVK